MPQRRTVKIGRETFQLVRMMEEGGAFYFTAGQAIAIGKFDMRPGKMEFDFQVNSRAVRGGRPESVAATVQGQDREFLERRTKANWFGLPVGGGNAVAMVRKGRPTFTYGQLVPDVIRSRVTTTPVAWRVWFKRTWYTGDPSFRIPGLAPVSKAANQGAADASARGSAGIGAATQLGRRRAPDAPARPLATDSSMLFIYVRVGEAFSEVAPFDRRDFIARDPTLLERARLSLSGAGR